MQRYSHRQLVLDPSLDYLPYSCSFRSDSIDAWFQSLEHSKEVPFEITEEPDRIVIRAKPEEVKAWVRAWCKTGAYECNRE
jgi:ferric-dicitrate binding protein FerR (iron transport regulator)